MPRNMRVTVRAALIKRQLSNENSSVELNDPHFKINIVKKKGAKFIVNGKLILASHYGVTNPATIFLDENATFQIDGDFGIGNGVLIRVDKNGLLKFGGTDVEVGSGITCNSTIYVNKKVEIGKDFSCAWNVFISDCDWHYIEYDGVPSKIQSDVLIGNHVWIAHDCSILKGTKIGNGSIVGSHSLLGGKTYPENSLIAGTPAKVIKNNCSWKGVLSKVQTQ